METTQNLYTPGTIRLHSGRYVDVTGLTKDDIQLEDIAHGLSHRCRFSGHTVRFYSVLEHSLRVAELVPAEHQLAALLHDASEAYLFDMPSPVKQFFPQLVDLEHRVSMVIFQRFGLLSSWPLAEVIKRADTRALEEEWAGLMISDNNNMGHRDPKNVRAAWLFAVRARLRERGMVQEGGAV
ncbi:hypothetical protein [Arsenicibacter rosenii]|uniref:Phosphohydrolase n=1 Tax=Arsenicibacter rosenii TaxID=1750698 RepID=A0A1S2VNP1_9BACT|nr:hypothetical protein [Arsenicibacter rosenii]OIN59786.1 hypothetical protein BLX24_07980 [Arsenicibacter rosenii]